MHPIRFKILRHRRWKNALFHEIKSVFFYNPREAFAVIAAVVAAILIFWPHEQARGTVQITSPMVAPQQYLSILDRPPPGPAMKHIDPKLMGSYTTTVDLHYLALGGNKAYMGVATTSLIGAQRDVKNNMVPDHAQINWAHSLKMQWDHKLHIKNVSPATQKWANQIVMSYANAPRDTKSVQTFVNEIDTIVKHTHRAIDYGQMCHDLHIEQCTLYYETMGRIRGVNIAAYGMTEIMPSHNGEFNYVVLDTLLRNAGENYINAIPSQGDYLLSKGMYQFTSFAIRRDASGLLGGANRVDNYLDRSLAGSVVKLSPTAAHKAAYMMATFNIGQVIKDMSRQDSERLAHQCSIDEVTQLIAVSHHMPVKAWRYGKAWVHAGCKKPLSAYLDSHLREYALKTKINMTALLEHERR